MSTIPILQTLPHQKDYWAVGWTHFFVDLLNSSRNLIVALLAVNLGLSNTIVAATLVIYNIGSALAQPLFGWLADRLGPRWLVIGGIGWMIGIGLVVALTDGWIALIAITFMGIGSGAFHPSGTSVATQIVTDYRNQATAIFFFLGQIGLFVGPILTGALIENFGYRSFALLPALAALPLAMSWRWVANHTADSRSIPPEEESTPIAWSHSRNWSRLGPLILTIFCYSSIGVTLMTLLPKFLVETDVNLNIVGVLSGLYMAGGAVGGYIGGVLADRFGGRLVVSVSLGLAVSPLFLVVPTGGTLQMVLLFSAGFFAGMPHSILVLAVQALLPGRKGFASGLVLGFMFFGGSLGSMVIGWAADLFGLGPALQGLALLPLTGAVTALWITQLQGRKHVSSLK